MNIIIRFYNREAPVETHMEMNQVINKEVLGINQNQLPFNESLELLDNIEEVIPIVDFKESIQRPWVILKNFNLIYLIF